MNTTGFDFSLAARNAILDKQNPSIRKENYTEMSTGTTITGLIFKDGVIIASDTRATAGSIVADAHCVKIEPLADKIYCAGAGTAADTFAVKAMIRNQLKLLKLQGYMNDPVAVACHVIEEHLFKYQGNVSAALIIGGVDEDGFHIVSLDPHGSAGYNEYACLGSGSLAARSVLCSKYHENMSKDEAMELAADAISAGILNDLASGTQVDCCCITKDGSEFIKGYRKTGTESVDKKLV